MPDTNYMSSILTTYGGTSGHPLLYIVFWQVSRNVLFSSHLTIAEGTGGSENAPERVSCGCPFWRGAPAQRRIHNAFDVEHENGASWGLDLDVGREPRAGAGGRSSVALRGAGRWARGAGRVACPTGPSRRSEYEFVIVFRCHLATRAAPVCISAGFNWGNAGGCSACAERALKNNDKLNL